MKIIDFSRIANLGISAKECVEWAKTVILKKREWQLPPKNSIHFGEECFFNTMPSYNDAEKIFGVKVVSRIPKRQPALKADILLYNSEKGELLSLMDGTWITAMRTGAVAAITAETLKKSTATSYSFVGLGNTARATLLCLDAIRNGEPFDVKILKYKDQSENFMARFKDFKNINFTVYDDFEKFAFESDVLISCITAGTKLFADEKIYQKGILIIPVQTRGFQNCDLVFDKIFCDDIGHISGFKYFSQYKSVAEMTDVLSGHDGRKNDDERILAYNIGVSIQDIYFAKKIYDKLEKENAKLNEKFWV